MESQAFSPKDLRLNPTNLIPPDEFDNEDVDVQWLAYCRIASTVDRTRILDVVLSGLNADDSLLFECIDDAITNPHEPGCAKANITDLARLGQSILNLLVKAVDEQVNMAIAVQEVPHD
jgi:hypothetical protein